VVSLWFALAPSVAIAKEPVVAAGRSIAVMPLLGLGRSEDALACVQDLLTECMLGRGVRVVERTRVETIAAGIQPWGAPGEILTAQFIAGGTLTGGKKARLTGNCRSVDTGDFVAQFEVGIRKWTKAGKAIDRALDGFLPEKTGNPVAFPTGRQFSAAFFGKDAAAVEKAFVDLLAGKGNEILPATLDAPENAPTHALFVSVYVVDTVPALTWRVVDTRSREVLLAGHVFNFPPDPASLAALLSKTP
jgi:hypothetical protein